MEHKALSVFKEAGADIKEAGADIKEEDIAAVHRVGKVGRGRDPSW